MGKSSQVAMDHDSSSDRITARVGSRQKKAKIVFDPSDHHVPRKRNRRGEHEPTAGTGTPKSEPTQTATTLSSSSNEGSTSKNHSSATTSVGGQRGTTATAALCRTCQKCGRSGPGRMPRKSPITPWTCSSCLILKTGSSKAGSGANKTGQSKMQSKSSRDRTSEEEAASDEANDEEEEEEEEEDNKRQHDFAGFSETELGGHEKVNDVKVDQKLYVREPHENKDGVQNKSNEPVVAATIKRTDSHDDGDERDGSAKDVRYWSCNDVCRFFSRHCKSWGDLFHEQEIDGASLLLMRKGDVLSRFGLKLGPAMELYQRIVALQNGDRDIVDVRLTWI
ncbi:sterile alpha motif domain-containing protein 1 [Anopheles maculipalpis]|uniref:sterile alpha motif domain-containing protein 1 n=1 Tax=Anopheles maculipalpis TaxID=1496333 RepID=UPI002159868A|nr:sterile alpha motif domain-containing protein 1 [Anopheles maculipalpis]